MSISLDQKIYRILDLKKFETMFFEKKNTLVCPVKWDDPMENLILMNGYRDQSGNLGEFIHKNAFYGQCWSTESRSDAMWRIYAGVCKNDLGIRVRTTVGKLLASLQSSIEPKLRRECSHISTVQYLSDPQLATHVSTAFSNGASTRAFFSTLAVKRRPFSWEKEVRLLYFDERLQIDGDLYEYNWEPEDVIDQIMVSPFNSSETFKKFKGRLKSETSFVGPILHSQLYKPPSNLIINLQT